MVGSTGNGDGGRSHDTEDLREMAEKRKLLIYIQILGIISILVFPGGVILILGVIEAFVSPIPSISSLQPFEITLGGNGVLLTELVQGIMIVGIISDFIQMHLSNHCTIIDPTDLEVG